MVIRVMVSPAIVAIIDEMDGAAAPDGAGDIEGMERKRSCPRSRSRSDYSRCRVGQGDGFAGIEEVEVGVGDGVGPVDGTRRS